MFLVVFAVIGGFRGWAKEILVVFSIVTAMAIDALLREFFPTTVGNLLKEQSSTAFYTRAAILMLMAYFGYQTPNLPAFTGGGRFAREEFLDGRFEERGVDVAQCRNFNAVKRSVRAEMRLAASVEAHDAHADAVVGAVDTAFGHRAGHNHG